MSKNGYLERRQRRDDVFKQASADTERQYMVDLFCMVLNDPAVMGKDVLGKKRLQKVVRAVMAEYNRWKDALTVKDEADYYRVKMDQVLGAIFGADLAPFSERYDWVADLDTKRRKK